MRFIKFKTYEEMSAFVADLFAAQLKLKPDSVLGLATGSTPVGTYKKLIEMYKNGEIDFSQCTTFNLDEYYPISKSNTQSYDYFMKEHLFNHVNISTERINIPDGEAKDAEIECASYDKKIDAAGGIDIQLLGLGENGHIGFNEPDTALIPGTHLTALTTSTIEANSRFFDSADDVPKSALTMGVGSILKAKKIIIAINGAKKLPALNKLLEGCVDTSCPATLLNLHSDVIVAYSEN